MNIDVTLSLEQWIALIKEFLEIIQNFFAELGLKFFGNGTTTEPAGE